MGTVINDRPDFYAKCIDALKDEKVDVIISCGNALDISVLRELPENIKVYPYVDQLDVLSRADAFITHCGMNSVSESLYMATPMILYPQTSEQQAVARRAKEIGTGVMLTNDSAQESVLRFLKYLTIILTPQELRNAAKIFARVQDLPERQPLLKPHRTNPRVLIS